jgi:tetratricopeptide (TPR) repeat protein
MSYQNIHLPKFARWKTLMILFCLSGFLTACSILETKEDNIFQAQEKYREALKFRNLKMKDEMHASFKEALRLNPEEPLYHFELAKAYTEEGRMEEAEAEYKTTLELNQNFLEAYRFLGRLYVHQERWKDAIGTLESLMKKSGVTNPQQVQNWLAICYYKIGDVNMAEKTWRESLSIKEDSTVRQNLARAYMANDQDELAIESLLIAVELDPNLAKAHYDLAQLYLKGNKKELAMKHFDKVIELEPLSKYAKNSKEYLRLIKSGK